MTKQNLIASLVGTIVGTINIVVSLQALIPNGQWLYLGALVFGTVILTNKFNAIIRS